MSDRNSPGPALPFRLLQGAPVGFLALCTLPGVMACGGSSTPASRDGAGFSQVDSAGVLLSITSGEKVPAPLGWTIASEPDLVLGGHESDYFHQIQGLQRTPDGGVLVVDGGSGELRFHDSEGRLVARATIELPVGLRILEICYLTCGVTSSTTRAALARARSASSRE